MVVHVPLLLLGLSAKKLLLLQTLRSYGWARVYRGICRVNRRITAPEHQQSVRSTFKAAIRSPTRAVTLLENNVHALSVLEKAEQRAAKSGSLPLVFAASILRSTKSYKWLKLFKP
mmetsp:Transcript_1700/g.5492  ORF Transcript_1700/g.5492 Transcript_1700/m.5492 type:complete len:116 (-) Transcript_1700:113-460(-)